MARIWMSFFFVVVLLESVAFATPSAVQIAPTDPRLLYVGRFDWRDPAGPRCEWSGSSVTVAFEGTALSARLRDIPPADFPAAWANPGTPEDFYAVIVDGAPVRVLRIVPRNTTYEVARDLPPGRHRVQLFKRTEPRVGRTQFLGFTINPGGRLLSARSAARLRVELIGDSITCGYGNEAPDEKAKFSARTENNYLAYGAIAARRARADYVCIAWSGRKLAPDETLPELYDRTLPTDPTSRWDFKKWTPDVVVINLATNDFYQGVPDRKMWLDAWNDFIVRLRGHYPKARVVVALGSMLSDNWPAGKQHLTLAREYLKAVVARRHAEGDRDVIFLEFQEQQEADGHGAAYHPSLRTYARMATELCKVLNPP